MSPSGVSSIFLLVVLMYMPDTSNAGIAEMCASKMPVACNIESYTWFVLDNKRCMKVSWDRLTFDQAQARCKSRGAQLVSIHNRDQNERLICFLYRMARGMRLETWIGARVGNDDFYWVDGSGGLAYNNWEYYQPDNAWFSEYCAQTNYYDWGLWNDTNCEDKLPFVCVKNK